MSDKYYTTVEVAAICQVTKETVRDWLRTEKIKGVKRGRSYLVSKENLTEFLEEKHG